MPRASSAEYRISYPPTDPGERLTPIPQRDTRPSGERLLKAVSPTEIADSKKNQLEHLRKEQTERRLARSSRLLHLLMPSLVDLTRRVEQKNGETDDKLRRELGLAAKKFDQLLPPSALTDSRGHKNDDYKQYDLDYQNAKRLINDIGRRQQARRDATSVSLAGRTRKVRQPLQPVQAIDEGRAATVPPPPSGEARIARPIETASARQRSLEALAAEQEVLQYFSQRLEEIKNTALATDIGLWLEVQMEKFRETEKQFHADATGIAEIEALDGLTAEDVVAYKKQYGQVIQQLIDTETAIQQQIAKALRNAKRSATLPPPMPLISIADQSSMRDTNPDLSTAATAEQDELRKLSETMTALTRLADASDFLMEDAKDSNGTNLAVLTRLLGSYQQELANIAVPHLNPADMAMVAYDTARDKAGSQLHQAQQAIEARQNELDQRATPVTTTIIDRRDTLPPPNLGEKTAIMPAVKNLELAKLETQLKAREQELIEAIRLSKGQRSDDADAFDMLDLDDWLHERRTSFLGSLRRLLRRGTKDTVGHAVNSLDNLGKTVGMKLDAAYDNYEAALAAYNRVNQAELNLASLGRVPVRTQINPWHKFSQDVADSVRQMKDPGYESQDYRNSLDDARLKKLYDYHLQEVLADWHKQHPGKNPTAEKMADLKEQAFMTSGEQFERGNSAPEDIKIRAREFVKKVDRLAARIDEIHNLMLYPFPKQQPPGTELHSFLTQARIDEYAAELGAIQADMMKLPGRIGFGDVETQTSYADKFTDAVVAFNQTEKLVHGWRSDEAIAAERKLGEQRTRETNGIEKVIAVIDDAALDVLQIYNDLNRQIGQHPNGDPLGPPLDKAAVALHTRTLAGWREDFDKRPARVNGGSDDARRRYAQAYDNANEAIDRAFSLIRLRNQEIRDLEAAAEPVSVPDSQPPITVPPLDEVMEIATLADPVLEQETLPLGIRADHNHDLVDNRDLSFVAENGGFAEIVRIAEAAGNQSLDVARETKRLLRDQLELLGPALAKMTDDEMKRAVLVAFQEVSHEIGKTIDYQDGGVSVSAVRIFERPDGGKAAVIAHVGNNRIYAVENRDGQGNVLVPLTTDQDRRLQAIADANERQNFQAALNRIRSVEDLAPLAKNTSMAGARGITLEQIKLLTKHGQTAAALLNEDPREPDSIFRPEQSKIPVQIGVVNLDQVKRLILTSRGIHGMLFDDEMETLLTKPDHVGADVLSREIQRLVRDQKVRPSLTDGTTIVLELESRDTLPSPPPSLDDPKRISTAPAPAPLRPIPTKDKPPIESLGAINPEQAKREYLAIIGQLFNERRIRPERFMKIFKDHQREIDGIIGFSSHSARKDLARRYADLLISENPADEKTIARINTLFFAQTKDPGDDFKKRLAVLAQRYADSRTQIPKARQPITAEAPPTKPSAAEQLRQAVSLTPSSQPPPPVDPTTEK